MTFRRARILSVLTALLAPLGCHGPDLVMSPAESGPDSGSGSTESTSGSASARRFASSLYVAPSSPSGPWELVDVEVTQPRPVQFAIRLRKEYPTAGWSVINWSPEKVEPRRFRMRVVEKAPEEPVAQVVTPQTVRVHLGILQAGRYELVIVMRRPGDASFEERQVIELLARAEEGSR